jgi:hypothetical protein
MFVAYLTTEKVYRCQALQMAQENDILLCLLTPSDPPPGGQFGAVLYDWDSVPVEQRPQLLTELLAGRAPRPVAVHGYELREGEAASLRKRGVAVYRGLQPEVFRLLRLTAGRPADAGPEGHPVLEERLARRLEELRRERLADCRRRALSCLQSAITGWEALSAAPSRRAVG